MKIAIVGGGISGLSTAYYLKKFALPVSQISLFEASSRFGGWINSKRVQIGNDSFYFEKGPRTLRLATGELKELNSIQLAKELNLQSSIEVISKKHAASTNRYIYFNNQVNAVKPNFFFKSTLMDKGVLSYVLKEFFTPSRDKSIKDESLWSFIARRFGPVWSDNLLDPVFKGICGGNIKELSAASILRDFYNYELIYGSVTRGLIMKTLSKKAPVESKYMDLMETQRTYKGSSIWRLKNGTQEIIDKLSGRLSAEKDVKLYLNEPIVSLEVDDGKKANSIHLKTKSTEDTYDIVISAISSKNTSNFLPSKYDHLKSLLNKIEFVNMVVVNFYFRENVLPLKGFGYLVPTSQKSCILGCLFDSIFNDESKKFTVMTVMMGGAWFHEYIGDKNHDQIYKLAFSELNKHLNLKATPSYHEVAVLNNAIPQYKVGHEDLIEQIYKSVKDSKLGDKLYLTGYSYEGVGLNDCIFNARKLAENTLKEHPLIKH